MQEIVKSFPDFSGKFGNKRIDKAFHVYQKRG